MAWSMRKKNEEIEMWVVIYLVKGYDSVKRLTALLDENGILVITRQKTNDEDKSTAFYEILVPQTEVAAAQDIIIENEGK